MIDAMTAPHGAFRPPSAKSWSDLSRRPMYRPMLMIAMKYRRMIRPSISSAMGRGEGTRTTGASQRGASPWNRKTRWAAGGGSRLGEHGPGRAADDQLGLHRAVFERRGVTAAAVDQRRNRAVTELDQRLAERRQRRGQERRAGRVVHADHRQRLADPQADGLGGGVDVEGKVVPGREDGGRAVRAAQEANELRAVPLAQAPLVALQDPLRLVREAALGQRVHE